MRPYPAPAEPVAIIGAGGAGRETEWLVETLAPAADIVFAQGAPVELGRTIHGRAVVDFEQLRSATPRRVLAMAIGAPAARQRVTEQLAADGFAFATLVHPRIERSQWARIDEGAIVHAGCILQPDCHVGRFVYVNIDCTIAHDVVIGDFSTLSPGVHISGCVQLGKRVFVGTGAVFINGTLERPLVVGDDAVIGAGACVTCDVPAGSTYVGVPARDKRSRPNSA